MCGFIGVFGNASNQCNLNQAIKLIKHRADKNDKANFYQSKYFSCAFHRLSINDLNARSNQPYIKKGYPFILCFNGEIYNYLELKQILQKNGYIFETNSDTEVVYYAFDFFKEECFKKLRGMFAICIFNYKNKCLYLCRDPLGIKPLYYLKKDLNIYFSSEIKPLKTFINFECEKDNILEFLKYGETLDESSIFKNIFKVNPGQLLKINIDCKIKKENYFYLINTFNKKLQSFEYEKLLSDCINLHTKCDVSYACQLSGGLDSGLICAFIKQHKHQLESFGVSFANQNVDETYSQNLIAEKLNLTHKTLMYKDFFNLDKLKQAIYFEDFPLHHPNILASNELNSMIKNLGFKMLISGDGADELFCGYKWHLLNLTKLKMLNIEEKIDFLSYAAKKDLYQCLNLKNKPINKELIYEINHIPLDNSMVFLGQKIYLQKWLRRQDRSGMQNSLEIRVPFVDKELFNHINPLSLSKKNKQLYSRKVFIKKYRQKILT